MTVFAKKRESSASGKEGMGKRNPRSTMVSRFHDARGTHETERPLARDPKTRNLVRFKRKTVSHAVKRAKHDFVE
jgi:hypothetical protein